MLKHAMWHDGIVVACLVKRPSLIFPIDLQAAKKSNRGHKEILAALHCYRLRRCSGRRVLGRISEIITPFEWTVNVGAFSLAYRWHAVAPSGDPDAGGFEDFFADMAAGKFQIPQDMNRIAESAGRHHLRFTGPPLGND
ncbi:hypothetical protein A4U53_005220 (plasmid) [Rhizobium ruizarguesonis]|uniref:Uncharacterized protein n=1 Tax=Rhizobium ruizarguesonis TaxID=2081791 RepID=A0ACD5EGZ1_9HYPH|nr:hypothetical protein [Rhizobium leguminosarum]